MSINIKTPLRACLFAKYSPNNEPQSFILDCPDFAKPYPGRSKSLYPSSTSKKLISVVLPGVLLILASFLLSAKQFKALDFPAFDLPDNKTSNPISFGRFFALVMPNKKAVFLKGFFIRSFISEHARHIICVLNHNVKLMLKTCLIISLSMAATVMFAADIKMPDLLTTGDANAGSKLVSTCASCHGADGKSISSDWPNLAGQNQRYLSEQLKYFQQGERENVLMMAVIPYLKSLSDSQLLDIAAFYSAQQPAVGQAKNDEELLALGESLYRAGDLNRGIPACTACHSVNGAGNVQAGFPKVSGQQKNYLISTLKEYRSLQRNAGDYSLVMQSASKNLNDYDIEALANYMHGLYEK